MREFSTTGKSEELRALQGLLLLNMKGPEQGRAHIPIQTLIQSSGSSPQIPFQTPSVPDHRMQYLKSDAELGSVPYLFHTRSRPNNLFSTYSPCIIVGTSKRKSSFYTLRIKSAIQTLRIRQHRNVHSGQVVLISSRHGLQDLTLRQLCMRICQDLARKTKLLIRYGG